MPNSVVHGNRGRLSLSFLTKSLLSSNILSSIKSIFDFSNYVKIFKLQYSISLDLFAITSSSGGKLGLKLSKCLENLLFGVKP